VHVHTPGTIQTVDDVRWGSGIAAPVRSRLQLQDGPEDGDRVVGGHDPVVVECADAVEVEPAGDRPITGGGQRSVKGT